VLLVYVAQGVLWVIDGHREVRVAPVTGRFLQRGWLPLWVAVFVNQHRPDALLEIATGGTLNRNPPLHPENIGQ